MPQALLGFSNVLDASCVCVYPQAEVEAAAATVAALSGERDSHRAAAEEAVQRANVSATRGCARRCISVLLSPASNTCACRS